jgi:PPE-repeat protein
MYTGPGSGPMLAAAAAWDGLATDLYSTTASYSSVISELTGSWSGPSAASMAAAAASHVEWLTTTAAQAEQTAAQAKAAVAAYEAAFAATVPPPVIAANRASLSALVATNFFGQNTPAIATTEAHYGEMWALDAAAMYGYAGASATASRITPFTAPPQTTNPAATTSQAAAVAHALATSPPSHAQTLVTTTQQSMSAVPNTLQGLLTPSTAPTTSGLSGILEDILNDPPPPILVDLNMLGMGVGGTPAAVPSIWSTFAITWALAATHAPISGLPLEEPFEVPFNSYITPNVVGPSSGTAVSAGMGQAHTLGRLSVPQGWATAAPAMPLASEAPAIRLAAAADNPEDLFRPMPFLGGPPLTTISERGVHRASQDRWRPPLLKLRPRKRSQDNGTE